MVLSTLDLANPVYEALVNKYLEDSKWDELLVKMWNTYQVKKETLSQEESETILNFIKHCLSFIDNCIHFNIINVTEHPPQPCVLEPLPETSLVLPSLQTQKQSSDTTEEHSQLTPTVSNHSETASIPFVFLSIFISYSLEFDFNNFFLFQGVSFY